MGLWEWPIRRGRLFSLTDIASDVIHPFYHSRRSLAPCEIQQNDTITLQKGVLTMSGISSTSLSHVRACINLMVLLKSLNCWLIMESFVCFPATGSIQQIKMLACLTWKLFPLGDNFILWWSVFVTMINRWRSPMRLSLSIGTLLLKSSSNFKMSTPSLDKVFLTFCVCAESSSNGWGRLSYTEWDEPSFFTLIVVIT